MNIPLGTCVTVPNDVLDYVAHLLGENLDHLKGKSGWLQAYDGALNFDYQVVFVPQGADKRHALPVLLEEVVVAKPIVSEEEN